MKYCESSKNHKYFKIHPAVVIGSAGAVVFMGLLLSNFSAVAQESKAVQVTPSRTASGNITGTLGTIGTTGLTASAASSGVAPKSLPGSSIPRTFNSAKTNSTDGAGGVYRQVLPDGKVLYTDHPVTGTKIDRSIPVESHQTGVWSSQPDMSKSSPIDSVPALTLRLPDDSVVVQKKLPDPELSSAGKELVSAKSKLVSADARLSAATLAMQDIDTPLADERSVNTNGTSRLNEKYFERQQAQRDEVQKAEVALDSALSAVSEAQSKAK